MPSIGAICRSMRTTSGARPSDSSCAQTSRASSPPPASATTSRSGSPSRNACSPRRTTSWSSTTSTRITGSGSMILCSVLAGHDDTHDRSPAGNAQNGQRGARLGSAGPHGFEAIVAGTIKLGVEAGAVVADLQRDGVTTRLDVDPGSLRRRMLDDVRERLPADGEELRFDSRAQGQALLRPADGDGEPFRVPERGGVAREARHEALLVARAVQ